ncbi:Oidioi.mRNA.OKI2018_I69.XSR.g13603.t1.cds [Oikopleura dioica]|uniref:Oidioi.mRNA.OKI2018_I69.XSR.g13603.t1.cds n=1 Tax=Oikopleura dioica TaxID=34765 RepID=A0ABN7SB29_OIKDI|nr:Oidioi.mRNA.OKI2018_I69.XSR.g13603.t1.cds [Oikopleura dioica]
MYLFDVYTNLKKGDLAFIIFAGTHDGANFSKKATRARLEKVSIDEVVEEMRANSTTSSIRQSGTLLKGLSQVLNKKPVPKTKKADKTLFDFSINDINDEDMGEIEFPDEDRNRARWEQITMRDESEFLNLDDDAPVELPYDHDEMVALFGENIVGVTDEELNSNFPSSTQSQPQRADSEQPSSGPSIPAPGPEFEYTAVQPPNDAPQQEPPAPEEKNPFDLSAIAGHGPETTAINESATEPAISLSLPQENIATASETPSPDDENNNETVTNEKRGKKKRALIIDEVISLRDPSKEGYEALGFGDVSELINDPFEFFGTIELKVGSKDRGVLKALNDNRREIFLNPCTADKLHEEVCEAFRRDAKTAGRRARGNQNATNDARSISSSMENRSTGEGRRNVTAENRSTASSSSKSNTFVNRPTSGNDISLPNDVSGPKMASTPFTSIPSVQLPAPQPPQVEVPQVEVPQVQPPQMQVPEFNPQPRSSSQGSQQDFKEALLNWLPEVGVYANFNDFCRGMKRTQAAKAFSALMALGAEGLIDMKEQEMPNAPIYFCRL